MNFYNLKILKNRQQELLEQEKTLLCCYVEGNYTPPVLLASASQWEIWHNIVSFWDFSIKNEGMESRKGRVTDYLLVSATAIQPASKL